MKREQIRSNIKQIIFPFGSKSLSFSFIVLVLAFFFLISLQAQDNNSSTYTDVLNVEDSLLINSIKDQNTSVQKNYKISDTFVNHTPISINSNKGFETCSCTSKGNGTIINPYTIENFFINGYSGNGISISNTDAYFIIQNVWVNATRNTGYSAGIYLYYVKNGLLTNNTVSYSENDGFDLNNSHNNTLINNTFYGNQLLSISLYYSKFNNITNNYFHNSNSGVTLGHSDYNNIINNTFFENGNGIYSGSSNYNSYIGNYFNYNYMNIICLDRSNNSLVVNNTVTNVNQIAISIISSVNNLLINNYVFNSSEGFFIRSESYNNTLIENESSNNVFSGFGTYNSTSNIFIRNKAINNGAGLYFYNSSFNILRQNYACNNSWAGFFYHFSNNNTIINNTAINHQIGFHLIRSHSNYLSSNVALDNEQCGFNPLNSYNSILIGNTASKNSDGFFVYSSPNTTLKENNAFNNSRDGFNIFNSTNTNLIGNNANNNSGFGIFIYNTSLSLIENNTAHYNLCGNFYSLFSFDLSLHNNSFTNPATIPDSPTNLVASSDSYSIYLQWKAPFSDGGSSILKYNIYVATSNDGPFEQIGSTSSLSYKITSIDKGKTYFYYVCAVNDVGESEKSNVISYTMPEDTQITSTTGKNESLTIIPTSPSFKIELVLILLLVISSSRRLKK